MATSSLQQRVQALTQQIAFHRQQERRGQETVLRCQDRLSRAHTHAEQQRRLALQTAQERLAQIEHTPPPTGVWDEVRLRWIAQQRPLTATEARVLRRHQQACRLLLVAGISLALVLGVITVPLLLALVLFVFAFGLIARYVRTNETLLAEVWREYDRLLLHASSEVHRAERETQNQRETREEREAYQALMSAHRELATTRRRLGELKAQFIVAHRQVLQQEEAARREAEARRQEADRQEAARLRAFRHAFLAELRAVPSTVFVPRH